MTTRSCDSTRPYLPVGDWRSYITLFKGNPAFLQFWSAGLISQLGNWFNYIAIFVLLTNITGSGHAVGWFLICKYIPTTILGPSAGVIADRISRKTIMITSDLLRVLIVLSFLVVQEADQVWIVYILALLQESVWTFYDPARRASIPNIVTREELNVANALGGATWSMMLAFGAAIGGIITALFSWQAAIIIDSLTFLISATMISTIAIPSPVREKSVGNKSWVDYTGLPDLVEGCRYITGHREVLPLLLVKSGWALSGGILVLLTWFGEHVFTGFGQGSGSGILYSFRGMGAALGPILAWRLLGETKQAMYRAIALSFLTASIAYLFFSRAPTLLAAIPFVFLGHLGGSVQWVFSTNLLQRIVPDQFRGRVFATEMALLTLVLSLSTWFTGAALDQNISPRTVAFRLALLFLLPGAIWTVWMIHNGNKNDN